MKKNKPAPYQIVFDDGEIILQQQQYIFAYTYGDNKYGAGYGNGWDGNGYGGGNGYGNGYGLSDHRDKLLTEIVIIHKGKKTL